MKSRRWTKEEELFLIKNASNYPEKELARKLNRSLPSIKSKKSRLGIKVGHRIVNGKKIKQREWTKEDDHMVIDWYKKHDDDLKLDELADKMGRTREYVSRKAGELGLTQLGRKPSWFIEEITKNLEEWNQTEEGIKQREENLQKMIRISKTNHPKGMKGKTHTKEFRKEMSKRVKKYWAHITPEQLEARTEKQIETRKRRGTLNPLKNQSNPYSRARGGRREDLNNQYFRSGWEANIARYFNHRNIRWEYEPKEFIFYEEKRGCISYTPDFYLPDYDKWIEVKGWMDNKSKIRLANFKKYYPEESKKLLLVDEIKYKEIEEESKEDIDLWE